MFASKTLKKSLNGTTALVSIGLLATVVAISPVKPAMAQNITITAATTNTQNLGAGVALTVTNTGEISGTTTAVIVTGGVAATSIDNSGTIQGSETGITINGASSLTGDITNSGTIAGSSTGNAFYMSSSSTVTGALNNSGTIEASSAEAIVLRSASEISGGLVNSGTISSDGNRAIYLRDSATIANGLNNTGVNARIEGSSTGIYLRNGASITGGLDNSGTISGLNNAGLRLQTGTITGELVNSGTIQGLEMGVYLSDTSTINGALTNSGTIKAKGLSGTGLALRAGSSITGLVTNTGMIIGGSSSGNGISVMSGSDLTGGLTNSGTIKVGGSLGTGLVLRSGASITGLVNNTGTIVGGSSSGNGISVMSGSDLTGGLTNSGTISALASMGRGIYLRNSTVTGLVDNSGTIKGGSSDAAIYLSNTSDLSGGLTNSGTISGGRGISIADDSDLSGGLINSGTILADVAYGVYIGGTTVSGDLTNSGTIEGNEGIYLSGGADLSGALTNSGIISGVNTGIYVNGSEISGGILNTGTIKGNTRAIHYTTLIGATTLTLNGSARIIGDVLDSDKDDGFSDVVVGTAFTTEGDFYVSDMTVTAGNTLTISAGNTVMLDDMSASAGTFEFAIDSAASFGSLVVDGVGDNIDLTGATVTAKVGAGNIADGNEIMIGDGVAQVIGLAGGAGQAAVAVTDNSFLWDFTLADGSQAEVTTGGADNTELYFVVDEANSIEDSADTAGGAAAGEALNDLSGSADAGIQALLDDMNGAATQEALNDVLEAIQPDMSGGAMAGALSVSNAAMGAMGNRLASLRTGDGSTGMVAGDAPQGRRMWGQIFGASADQDRRNGTSGYDANTYGLAIGIDTENLIDNSVVGVAVSYGNTDVDSDSANNASTDVNSYQFTLYGDYDLDNKTSVNGMAAYTRHTNETTRVPLAGSVAKGDYDANQYSLKVGAGHDYYKNEGFTVTPNVMGHWTHYDPESYTETGAGGAGLTVDGDSVDILELGVGTDLTWQHQNSDGSTLEPKLSVGYRYDVIGDKAETTANFIGGGAGFKTTGADPAQSTFNVGAGLKYYDSSNIELTADYDFEFKSDYTAHSAFMRAAMKF